MMFSTLRLPRHVAACTTSKNVIKVFLCDGDDRIRAPQIGKTELVPYLKEIALLFGYDLLPE